MRKFLIILFLLSLIPLSDLFRPGLPVTHDSQDHVARIANFYQNLSDGNIIPRWAPNLNWGYGHPILMFLYPLPSYSASLFHFLGFSFVDSFKIILGISFTLSGIFMFIWLREFLEDFPAFLGALLYVFAPYRFVDLYVRGALGEHFAFVFLPLILYFLLKLSKEKKFSHLSFLGGAFSLMGLFLSHNAVSIMFLPVAFLYSLYLLFLRKERNELVVRYFFVLAFGIGLSAFFLSPAYFEGKYTLRDIVTAKDYAARFMDIKNFIYSQWNYGISGQFTVQLGILQWIFVIASLPVTLFFYKQKNKLWILSLGTIVLLVMTIFLMTPQSQPVWDRITILQKFQFPWRFLTVAVFLSAALAAIVISQIKKKKLILPIIIIGAILFLSKDYWHAKDYILKNESFFTQIYNGTTDTGESSPVWSVRFMERRPKSHMEVIEGDASVMEIKRTSTKHEYKIDSSGPSRLRENTLYFPGWIVLVDGVKAGIEFQDPNNRGVITFGVSKGKHDVLLEFRETKLRLLSNAISFFSLALISFILLWKNRQFRLF